MYYDNVIWNRVYVKWINRYTAQSHSFGVTVQINDLSDIFNYYADITSTTFFCEKTWNLQVTVWWWPILDGLVSVSVSDTVLNLTNNTTNYIYYISWTNTINVWTSIPSIEALSGIITAEIICAGGVISSISYRNYKLNIAQQWAQGIPWAIGNTGNTQQIQDLITQATWANTVYNDWLGTVTTTNADGSYIVYTTTGITSYDPYWNIIAIQVKTWTYDTLTHIITYTDWNTVSWVDWNVQVTNWNIAYRNQSNTFTEPNIFTWDTSFTGRVVVPYYENISNTSTFDASLWIKHKFVFTDWLTHTLNWQNLLNWSSYEFAIVVTTNPAVLSVGTLTNCDTVTTMYSIWWTVYPLTLSVGVHLFAATTYNTWVHTSYLSTSIAT